MAVVVLLVVPAGIGIGAIADPLVRLLLGEKWLDAVPIIQILAVATAIAVMSSSNSSAFLAMGKPHQWTLLIGFRLAVLLPLVILLTRVMGLTGAALAELAASTLFLGISVPLMLRYLQLSYSAFFSRIWRPIVSSGLMMIVVALVLRLLPVGGAAEAATQLVSGIGVGIATYLAAIVLFWVASGRPHGAETVLLARVSAWRRRHDRQVL
jgi:O-antigen/teichoic acid export membrane protein